DASHPAIGSCSPLVLGYRETCLRDPVDGDFNARASFVHGALRLVVVFSQSLPRFEQQRELLVQGLHIPHEGSHLFRAVTEVLVGRRLLAHLKRPFGAFPFGFGGGGGGNPSRRASRTASAQFFI